MSEFLSDDKLVVGSKVLEYAGVEVVLEQACTYKTIEAAKLVAKLIGVIDVEAILPQLIAATKAQDQASLVFLAQKLLPMIAEEAPEVLLTLAALAMAPNTDLRTGFRRPNGIKKVVDENKEWLLFVAPPEASIEIAAEYIPYLGIDRLKNAISPLIAKLSGLVEIRVEEVEETTKKAP